MIVPSEVYTPLEQARQLIQERWNDFELRKRVENVLGEHFWPQLREQPRGVLWRCLCPPDNGFTFFVQATRWLGLTPFLPEYRSDKFVRLNEEKKGLGRLRLTLEDGSRVSVDILNWQENQSKPLNEVVLLSGENMAGFYRRLFDLAGYGVMPEDLSAWWIRLKPAANYYYYYLSHFIAHGVLFEHIEGVDDNDARFDKEVILPNLERVEREFGVKPLIVRLYPFGQTAEEDFYWWCYPPHVNAWLVNWAREQGLKMKPWRPKAGFHG